MKQFKKVYFMVGINECSYGTTEKYKESYAQILDDIRKLQPNAVIFLQGNLYITENKSRQSKGLTNSRISERNEAIASLADGESVFYIDINESSLCENGALVPSYTWDQIHIKAEYYPIWKEFYLDHGIIK